MRGKRGLKTTKRQLRSHANTHTHTHTHTPSLKVENGDLNWCLEGKFLAFAGPHATRETTPGGYHSLCPDDYVTYFKRRNVGLVIRLNKKVRSRFCKCVRVCVLYPPFVNSCIFLTLDTPHAHTHTCSICYFVFLSITMRADSRNMASSTWTFISWTEAIHLTTFLAASSRKASKPIALLLCTAKQAWAALAHASAAT